MYIYYEVYVCASIPYGWICLFVGLSFFSLHDCHTAAAVLQAVNDPYVAHEPVNRARKIVIVFFTGRIY